MLILQNDLQFSGEQDTDKITFMLELTEGIIKCLHFNLLSEYCTVDHLEKTLKLQQTGLQYTNFYIKRIAGKLYVHNFFFIDK